MQAGRQGVHVLHLEPGLQQGGVPDEAGQGHRVGTGRVGGVGGIQRPHQGVARVDLQDLCPPHVGRARRAVRARQGLRPDDLLHVSGPAVGGRGDNGGGGAEAGGDDAHGGDDGRAAQGRLPPGGQRLEGRPHGRRFRFVPPILVPQRQPLLGRALQLDPVKLGQVLGQVLVDGVREEEGLHARARQAGREGRPLEGRPVPARQVKDGFLPRLHPPHVARQGGGVGRARRAHPGRGRLEPEQAGQAGPVQCVLHDAQLDRLPETRPESGVGARRVRVGPAAARRRRLAPLLLALAKQAAALLASPGRLLLRVRQLLQGVQRLADDLLLDGAQGGRGLERLPRDGEGQGVGVDHAGQEAQVLGEQVLAEVVAHKHAAHVQADGRAGGIVVFVEGGRRGRRHVEHRPELDIALRLEVCVRQGRRRGRARLGQGGVEGGVVGIRDVAGRAQPDGGDVVQALPGPHRLLHFFGGRRGGGRGRAVILLVLDRKVFARLLLLLLLGAAGLLRHFLLHRGGRVQQDGVPHKLRVLGDEAAQGGRVAVLRLVPLQEQADRRTAPQGRAGHVLPHLERAVRGRLPHPLGRGAAAAAALGRPARPGPGGHDLDPVGHQVGRVEAHPKLADQGRGRGVRGGSHPFLAAAFGRLAAAAAGLAQGVQEGGRPRLGDGAQVGHQLVPAHAHARVPDLQDSGRRPGRGRDRQPDLQLLRAGAQGALVREGRQAQLVQSVRRVGDELPQEDVRLC